MATVIERTEGHYDVRKIPYGRTYVWYPGCVVVECECGERPDLTSSTATCRCGADYTALVRKELAVGRSGDETLHPWRYTRDHEGVGLPF